jgi:tetratricopeptide (TPR) repeat protein
LIYKELNKETVIIEPFQVPLDLEKQNITGQAIVNKLVDQIEIIKANADTTYKKLDVKPTFYDSQLEILIPVSGISLKSLLQNIKNFLGKKQTRISGEVVMNDKKLILTIRVFGEPSKTFTGSLDDLDDILKEAAQYILKYTQPYLLAYYLFYNYNEDDKESAMDMIHYALTHPPKDDDAMAYNLEGNILFEEKKYEEAIKSYKKAIELDSKSPDAYNNWAYTLNVLGKTDSAIDLYKKSIGINPNYYYTYHYWGLALADQEKYDEAFQMFDKSIKLNPEYSDVYIDYGSTLFKLQKYDEAIDKFKTAIELDPKFSETYYLLGKVYLEQKKYNTAIDMFEKATKLNSKYVNAYIELGNSLLEQEKYSEAIDTYKKAITIDDKNKEPYEKIAMALEKQDKKDEAVQIYKKLISIAPSDSAFFSEKIQELKKH